MKKIICSMILALLFLQTPRVFAALVTPPTDPPIELGIEVTLEVIIPPGDASGGDALVAPLWGSAIPGGKHENILMVIDQIGKIWAVDLDANAKSLFLDVVAVGVPLIGTGPLVFSGAYTERGLLGLAIHPKFKKNGLFYTYTSESVGVTPDFPLNAPDDSSTHFSLPTNLTVVREWELSDPKDLSSAIGASRVLMRIEQPQGNHEGGGLTFGRDKMLYISLGDGGLRDDDAMGHTGWSAALPAMDSSLIVGNAQDISNVLGSILRIDPLGSNSDNGQYGIPADNPFVSTAGARGEIFAYGFRNPYRISADSKKGTIFVGDVGQGDIEEVDIVISGQNYGWNDREGTFCFETGAVATSPFGFGDATAGTTDDTCPIPGHIDPIAQYSHDDGVSVIAGYVYRGKGIKKLRDRFVFGEYAETITFGPSFSVTDGRLFYTKEKTKKLAKVTKDMVEKGKGTKLTVIKEMQFDPLGFNFQVYGFGQDAKGELYVLGNSTGVPGGLTGFVIKIKKK